MVKSHMCEHQRQILHVQGVWFGWLGRKSYMCRLLIGPKCLSFSEPYCGYDSGFTCVSIRGNPACAGGLPWLGLGVNPTCVGYLLDLREKSSVCRWFALVGQVCKSYLCRH